MAYNFKINNLLNKVSDSFKEVSNNSSDFVSRANDASLSIQEGIIDSLFIVNDSVFAIVRKNTGGEISPSGFQVDHGDGWFNGPDRTPIIGNLVPALAILTNISAINNNMSVYKNKPCRVTVRNNIAVYVEVDLGYRDFSIFPTRFLMEMRTALENKTDDIFSDIGKEYMKEAGYTDDDIKSLSDFKYVEEMTGKVNTIKGEGLWFKDTAKEKQDENILKNNSIVVGLNKLGMKTKNCHIPTKFFSGK